ncbi:hypothetical protein PUNSTDRAFT_68886 [Punctularia strigosozonata HHB-11173 SS5]|uniref:uncharacterized protein n=1 Tax=Punctularia strigosozonata (strain HHB-11173) TaxID=741275 RepID=UPI000441696C|nr:uncharacterized protein PUNSTDRAFT_68886 [Punctularia strigosozonata HHB-11173 SS5]EIN08671.1 hypothetical protein PUNSTDRAFT_68886 [Punctularia strigosozonata HHB-11173 SS5]
MEKVYFGRTKNKVHTEDVRSVRRTEPPPPAVDFQAGERGIKVRPLVAMQLEPGAEFIDLPEEIKEALPPSEPIGLNEAMEKISQQLASDIIQKIPNYRKLRDRSYTIMLKAERGNANWLWFKTLDLSRLFLAVLVKKVERKVWQMAIDNLLPQKGLVRTPCLQSWHLMESQKDWRELANTLSDTDAGSVRKEFQQKVLNQCLWLPSANASRLWKTTGSKYCAATMILETHQGTAICIVINPNCYRWREEIRVHCGTP